MGGHDYMYAERATRSATLGYSSVTTSHADFERVFTQQKLRRIHESMDPRGLILREARDSDIHPCTLPMLLGLDLTGSMGLVPKQLIADGLPTLMSALIQAGAKDAALLFVGVGDHECDEAPLQVGQFESGDEQLDMWLTRTWVEGGGGSNEGESYILAWLVAAKNVVTDAWEKRKQKGILITVGDEPPLLSVPRTALKEIYGGDAVQKLGLQDGTRMKDLLAELEEKWWVFHIHYTHGGHKTREKGFGLVYDRWESLLGQRFLVINDHEQIPQLIVDTMRTSGILEGPCATDTGAETAEESDQGFLGGSATDEEPYAVEDDGEDTGFIDAEAGEDGPVSEKAPEEEPRTGEGDFF